MDALELLNRTEEDLRAWALSQETSALERTFDEVWQQIRNLHLYAGQPRSAESERGVALARACLQVAAHLENDRLTVQAWRMLAYSLTANEQYDEALPYYDRAIQALDAAGEIGRAHV